MNEVCEQNVIHKDVVNKVGKMLLDENKVIELSELFKIFGDNTRIKILSALIKEKMCVCDIAALLNMTHSAISHQLRILKQGKIVKYTKVGKVVYYEIDDEHIGKIFEMGVKHIEEA